MSKLVLIGTGNMGLAIGERLLKEGNSLTVYNRTKEKAKPLANMGAVVANSIEEAVKNAEIIFSSLIDDHAVLEVSDSLLKFAPSGLIHASASTILPKTAASLAELHAKKGAIYAASPLLGIPKAVRAQQATTICSGPNQAIDKLTPFFKTYSKNIMNLGEEASHANVLKICLNYSLLTSIELFAELYTFAEKSGLDKKIVQDSLKGIYSHPAFHVYIDKIYEQQFDQVNFTLKGGNKDIKLFQEAFLDVNVSPDIANTIQNKFTEALAEGNSDKDWSFIAEITRRRGGL